MIDTKNLRTLAENATPGPWGMREIDPDDRAWGACEVIGIDGAVFVSTHVGCVADACHIATFNPKTILELLDALERKDRLLQQALDALDTCVAGDYSTGHVIYPSFDCELVDAAFEAITKEIWT